MIVSSRLAPSARPHGAQRMFSATIFVLEAFVVFFTLLAAHQLVPDQRLLTWTWGGLTILALLAVSGLLRRGAWPYLTGMVLQIPVVALGLQVSAMWVVGSFFALLYVYAVFKGNQLDREKDAVDRRVLGGRSDTTGEADEA